MTENKASFYKGCVIDVIEQVQKSKRSHYLMNYIYKHNYEFIQNNIIESNNLVDLNELSGNIENKYNINEQILFDNIIENLDKKQYQQVHFIIEQFEKEVSFKNYIDPYLQFIKIKATFLFWLDNINFSTILNDGLSVNDDIDNHVEGIKNMKAWQPMDIPSSNFTDADVKFGISLQPINITTILEKVSKLILNLDKSDHHYILSALYLLSGNLLLIKKEKAYAVDKLTRALKFDPYNWEAYEAIVKSITLPNEIVLLSQHISKNIKQTVLYDFFQIQCWDEFFESIDAELYIELLTTTLEMFPKSKFLLTKNAELAYKLNDLPQSKFLYEQLLKRFPFCLDTMFKYSNILYVSEDYPKLRELMVKAKSISEISCEYQAIRGNMESLTRNNEKAIIHFKNAIKLAKTDSSKKCKLYVLIGHEFVELGNYNAAIFAYRNAVKHDHKDYAAWMGLGFAYDALDQSNFAIYYYQKCIALKNEDPRAWKSIASSFTKLEKMNLAYEALLKAYKLSEQRTKKMAIADEIISILKQINDVQKIEKWLKTILEYPEPDEYHEKALGMLVELYRNTGRIQEAENIELSRYQDPIL
ncbi:uncharacterized protein HGUI_00796 [Hanseniaspora guilliermondii]|uniref:Cdc23 domain-containing protein n=1 Tax=Hanseniaspora guilliermondii TaxID=56406 RepID=A0A1L0AYH7_9ASCO|nr:uncharacterized protein HGUI_00796 [Hanseniaspora guilliermondii]